MSSYGTKGAPSCIDVVGVITWLKPVEEARADAFSKKYSLPPNIRVSFPSSRAQFVTSMEEDRGRMNFMYWLEVHINEGLRFPLPPLVH